MIDALILYAHPISCVCVWNRENAEEHLTGISKHAIVASLSLSIVEIVPKTRVSLQSRALDDKVDYYYMTREQQYNLSLCVHNEHPVPQ